MTFEQFKQSVVELKPEPWRLGQTAFNLLLSEKPHLAERVRATAFDPFHDDDVLPRFYDYIELYWEASA